MIHALGVNFNQHPIEETDYKEVNTNLLLLSTCNRTEVYFSDENVDVKTAKNLYNNFPTFHYSGRVAIRHIVEVTCGVKSSVLGDRHVYHQLKEAYENCNPSEPIHKLLNKAFQAAKKVQLNDSVPLQAVKKATPTTSALIIGAGEMAEGVLSHLKANKIFISNRTRSKAEDLRGKTVDWNKKEEVAKKVETVFVTTGALSPIFNSNPYNNQIFDLSVPHNVKGPAIRLEDLKSRNKEGIARAKKICRSKTEEYMDWHDFYKNKKPIIELINNRYEELRKQELDKYGKEQMSLEEVERLTESIGNKFISIPAKNLKMGAENITELFNEA